MLSPFVAAAAVITGSVGVRGKVDDLTAPTHYVTAFLWKSLLVLGSQDPRFGEGISYAYGRPEPRFQLGTIPAQLVYEGYYDHSHSPGVQEPSNNVDAVGVLAYARWRGRRGFNGAGFYADLGWGLQYASRHSFDLDTLINSTPVLDFGAAVPFGSQELMVGLRYLHISNGGADKPNLGQNELFFTVGVRF